jgi:hypothetical protein
MKIIFLLNICCFPENTSSFNNKIRTQQYIDGLNTVFQYNNIIKNHDIDVYIVDNTIKNDETLPREILNIIPSNVNLSLCLKNELGKKNKGAGLIDTWKYNKDLIQKYDWIIHFEPRQSLKSFQFVENFLKEPRNLFTININVEHFNTGLFCISKENLLNYINNCDLNKMVNNSISIEDDLYKYFQDNKINYDTLEKMDLLWFAGDNNTYHY